MNISKIIGGLLCGGLGTVIGWWAMRESWLFSLLAGPLQHFGLAFLQFDNSNEYLDGVSKVETFDYIVGILQIILWIMGLCIVHYWFNGQSKTINILFLFAWLMVGALNIYLFAIRSV